MKPDSMLAAHLRETDTAFFERTMELVDAPTVLWGKSKEGAATLRVIDCGVETRLSFMAEYCDAQQSPAAAKRACEKMALLIGQWTTAGFPWWRAPDFVEELSGRQWFMQHGGGDVHQQAMERLLDSLPAASASNWCSVFDLRENDIHWCEEYNDRMEEAFAQFTGSGLDEQLKECTSLEDKKNAVEALEMLGKKANASFSLAVTKIEQEISELEAEEEEPEIGPGAPSAPPETLRGKSMTDDEVRQMFLTLASS